MASSETETEGVAVETRGYAIDLVEACGVTGQVGCMDCIEGQCEGAASPAIVEVRRCLRCGGHDAFGELVHDDDCLAALRVLADRTESHE